MPFADNQGIRIYWDEQGHGPALLLIAGIGCPSQMWSGIRPALAAHYRTIALDNRGTGESDVPPGPYPVAQMASDDAGVIAWEAYSRLPQIRVPTLVIHGDSDRLVPPANGELLAERVPGAQCTILPRAGHLFFVDQPEATQAALTQFLSRIDAGGDETEAIKSISTTP